MKRLRVLMACLVCSFSASVLADDAVDLGIAEFKAGKYRTALKRLQEPAEAGNAEAQLYMGRLYAGGRAGVMDDFEAANWFEKSARQDNAEAQYHLARLYLSGWGLSKDPKAAMEWLWKSGRLGFLKSQLLLGELLSAGEVVPQDLDAARLWYAQAANQGSIKAREQLDKLGGAAALPDGGEGLAAPTTTAADATETLDDDSRAAIVRRRIEELKSARKTEVSTAALASGGAALAVVTQQEAGADVVADLPNPDVVMADADGNMEIDEMVLEEFETDSAGFNEVLEMDAGDDASDGGLTAEEPVEAASAAKVVASDPVSGSASDPAAAPLPEGGAADPVADSSDGSAVQTDGLQGRDWVLSRNPAHYTIQLLGSWKRADAQAFVDANPLPGIGALIETKRRGKPWFSLYYGDFAKYSEAVAAQSALKGGIAKHGPWVRPYKKIQAGLK